MDLKKFDKIYDDVDSILENNPCYINGMYHSDPVDDSKILKLKKYAEGFINETDRGLIQTILTCIKPFCGNIIIQDVYITLVKKLNKQ